MSTRARWSEIEHEAGLEPDVGLLEVVVEAAGGVAGPVGSGQTNIDRRPNQGQRLRGEGENHRRLDGGGEQVGAPRSRHESAADLRPIVDVSDTGAWPQPDRGC